MSRPKGIPKTGGRQRGVVNKRTLTNRARLQRTRDLSAAAVEEQIRRNALYDPRRLFTDRGTLKPIVSLSEADAAMIEGIDVAVRHEVSGATYDVIKYKLASRSAFVRMAGEIHGMFRTRTEHELAGSLLELLTGIRDPT